MRYKDIVFDDYAIDEEDGHVWSNICEECAKKYGIPNRLLDRNYGEGTCSVEGCNNASEYYIDFPDMKVSALGKCLGMIPNVVEFTKEEEMDNSRKRNGGL